MGLIEEEREGEKLKKTKQFRNWDEMVLNLLEITVEMEPMDQIEPAGIAPYKLNPLGRMKNFSGGSLQRAPQNSVPDIRPELRSDLLTGLRLDGFSRCVRRPFRVIQSLTCS